MNELIDTSNETEELSIDKESVHTESSKNSNNFVVLTNTESSTESSIPNMVDASTSTDDLIFTLKFSDTNTKIIDYKIDNSSNLSEFKRQLQINNERRLQVLFEQLISKQNLAIENDFSNIKINSNPEIIPDNKPTENKSYDMKYKIINNKFYDEDDTVLTEFTVSERKNPYNKKLDDRVKNINIKNSSDDLIQDDKIFEFTTESSENLFEPENFKLNSYFDKIYIISLKDERSKIKNIINYFSNMNVKVQIMDGIDIKTDKRHMKIYYRWLYQQNLDENLLNKFVFDEKIYSRKNSDIKSKINNKSKAWNHWNKVGKEEGRKLYEKTSIKNVYQLGCLIAHSKIIDDALRNNFNRILILEDDIYLHKNFNEIIEKRLEKVPLNWSLLYFGAVQKKWDNISFNDGFYQSFYTSGAFAYGLHKRIFLSLKNLINELIWPMDKCLQQLQLATKKSYVIYPNIIISDLEKSKIHKKRDMEQYSKIFKWNLEDYVIQN